MKSKMVKLFNEVLYHMGQSGSTQLTLAIFRVFHTCFSCPKVGTDSSSLQEFPVTTPSRDCI